MWFGVVARPVYAVWIEGDWRSGGKRDDARTGEIFTGLCGSLFDDGHGMRSR